MRLHHLVLHLRLPFSIFLLPIALLGLLAAPSFEPWKLFWTFLSLHLFLYPASNAFNSYYDKDEGPIGGLSSPPPVGKPLLVLSLLWEALGLAAAFMAGPGFGVSMVVYGIFSKLYSWDKTRWKARPLGGLAGIILGQGALTFMAVAWTLDGVRFNPLGPLAVLGALAATLLLLGVYPLTQIYQHEEDKHRGDLSYSRLLGIRGTFLSSLGAFTLGVLALGGFLWIRFSGNPWGPLLALVLALAPALIYFLYWMRISWLDPSAANFKRTMIMNTLASLGLNLFFLGVLFFYPVISPMEGL